MSIRDFSSRFSGSSPRSSVGLYNTITNNTDSIFSPKKSSRPRMLTTPSNTKSMKNDSIPFSDSDSDYSSMLDSGKDIISTTSAINSSINQVVSQTGNPFLRYLSIFIIIGFLFLNLFLYLTKPINSSIFNMYDPLLKKIGINNDDKPQVKNNISSTSKKVRVNKEENKNAINKLEKVVNNKKTVNNIDSENIQKQNEEQGIKSKQKPFIPEPDVSASRLQANKPTSKQGYCYIGEDRGFRSCIEVGKGDVCMSGDIFPTKDICINPNLRE